MGWDWQGLGFARVSSLPNGDSVAAVYRDTGRARDKPGNVRSAKSGKLGARLAHCSQFRDR